ncbi:hypothetical protein MVEN_00266700 [Mycena venus]|uniref:Uncharacterized protein n=1 Tax=Mycena venus TaxID=2733690 RepID=A0A8H6Z2P1_9AGAR|nr:hypothetical protein MVEN_00266700 [Mycena venus]
MVPLALYAIFAILLPKLFIYAAASGPDRIENSLTNRAASPLTLTGANWIWSANYTTANTLVALRKDFVPPLGRSLIAAEIIMTASTVSFYVNGELIGQNLPPSRWQYTGRYCVDLLPSFNVFAASSSSVSIPKAAAIAAIRVTYDDFTTDTILTDTSWRAHPFVAGFEQLSFDDTAWSTAIVKATYPGAPYNAAAVASNPPVLPLPLTLGIAWIWTDAIPASGTIPAGTRAFRRTFTPMPGQVPMFANIVIAADDLYTLWVNGVQVGTGSNFKTAQQYTVNFVSAPSEVVFAVLATNSAAGNAGVLFAAEINMVPSGRANCTAGAWVVGDTDWVSTVSAIPTGWQAPGFDDSEWPLVVAGGDLSCGPVGKHQRRGGFTAGECLICALIIR